tara:strand:+ start:413 stop:700 length:288 start_codon:yes stop_codon:yes gene_type:complete
MDFQKIYTIIINEPIYLTITIIFILIISYSILKKLIKMLVFSLLIFILYMGYLMYTGQDLPDLPDEKQVRAVKEQVVKQLEKGIEKLDKMGKIDN